MSTSRPTRSVNYWRTLCLLCTLFVVGCNPAFDPSKWNQDEVAKDIKEQWAQFNVTEVAVSPVTGGFEGTAKSADGETFKIALKKDETAKSIRGTGVGDRGTELTYSAMAKAR